jgi:hypothetical protein
VYVSEEGPKLFLDEGEQFAFAAQPVSPRQLREKVGQRAPEHSFERAQLRVPEGGVASPAGASLNEV